MKWKCSPKWRYKEFSNGGKLLFLEHENDYYNTDIPLEDATFSRETPKDYNPDFPPIWHEYDIRECKLKI